MMNFASYTHTSVQSGDWSDTTTWDAGTVPGAGDTVKIASGHTVVYDAVTPTGSYTRADLEAMRIDYANNQSNHALVSPYALKGILVEPTATFKVDTSQDTFLLIETIYVDSASLVRGEENDPILESATAGKARHEIMLIGLVDPTSTMALGISTKNSRVRIWGAEKTSDIRIASDVSAGTNTVTLAEAPTGWRVGDTISLQSTDITSLEASDTFYTGPTTFAGPNGSSTSAEANSTYNITGYKQSHDEVRTITGIAGAVITVDSNWTYDHIRRTQALSDSTSMTLAPRVTMHSYSIQTTGWCVNEKGSGANRRAHTMDMFSGDVVRKFARWLDMGRSRIDPTQTFPGYNDASNGLKDTPGGSFIADPDNVIGRYVIHDHWGGYFYYARAVINEGLMLDSTPGCGFIPSYGYVQHNSRMHGKNINVYRVRPSGMICETGREIGQWENCGVIWARGDGFSDAAYWGREEWIPNQFGHNGTCFDMQARQVILRDCWGSSARRLVSWMQSKAIAATYHTPLDTALPMLSPIANNMGADNLHPFYDGGYGAQQAQIPDLFGLEGLDVDDGIIAGNRDVMDYKDMMPMVSNNVLLLSKKPYHIPRYSHNYMNHNWACWGDGGTAITLGTKTFGHTFVNSGFIGYTNLIDDSSLDFNGELIDLTGDWTTFQVEKSFTLEDSDYTNHIQDSCYGFTQVGTAAGGEAIVTLRTHVNLDSSTDLPRAFPGGAWNYTDPEPGLATPRFYDKLANQNTQTVGPNDVGTLTFKGQIVDSVGSRAWPSYARFNAPNNASGEPQTPTDSNDEMSGTDLVIRNKWYNDGGTKKMCLWFYDADRITKEQISIPYIVELTGTWDQDFLDTYEVADANATLKTLYPMPLQGYGYSDTPVVETKVTPFSFATKQTSTAGATVESDAVLIARLTYGQTVPITVTNGEFTKDDGATWAISGTVTRLDQVKVRGTAPAAGNTLNVGVDIGTQSATFSIDTLTAYDQEVVIDLGNTTEYVSPANRFARATVTGNLSTDLLDIAGASTGIGLECDGIPQNVTTNADAISGIPEFPDAVFKYAWWQGGTSMSIRLTGLDPAKTYDLMFLAYTTNFTGGSTVTTFTVNGVTAGAVDAQANLDTSVDLLSVSPDGSGEITVTATRPGANYAIFTAMRLMRVAA